MKTLWINLIKYMQDLYSENCKMLLREIKEDPPPQNGVVCHVHGWKTQYC